MTASKPKFSFLKQISLSSANERQVTLLVPVSDQGNLHFDAEATSIFSATVTNSTLNQNQNDEEESYCGLAFISCVGQFGNDEKRVINMVAEPLTLKQCKFSRLRDKKKAGIYCTTPASGPVPSMKYHNGKMSLHCLDANLSDISDDVGFCASFLFLRQLSSVMILYADEFSHEKIKLALQHIRTDEPKRPLAHVICAYRKQQPWALQKLDLVTQLSGFYDQVNISDARYLKSRGLNLQQVQGMCEPLTFKNKRVNATKAVKTLQKILDEVKVQLEIPLSPVNSPLNSQRHMDSESLARHNRTLGQFTQYCNQYLSQNFVLQGTRPETSQEVIFDAIVSDFCTNFNINPETLQEEEEHFRQILLVKLEAFFGKIPSFSHQTSENLGSDKPKTSSNSETPVFTEKSNGEGSSKSSRKRIGSSLDYVISSKSSVRRNRSWKSGNPGRPLTTSFLERNERDERSGIFNLLDLEFNRILEELQAELVESEPGTGDFIASLNMSGGLKDKMRFESFQIITEVHEEIHHFSKDVSAIRKLVRDFRGSWTQALDKKILSEVEINQVKANIKLNVSQLRFQCLSFSDELVKLMQSAVKRELIQFKRRFDKLIAISYRIKPLSPVPEPKSTEVLPQLPHVQHRAPNATENKESKETMTNSQRTSAKYVVGNGSNRHSEAKATLNMEDMEATTAYEASLDPDDHESKRCTDEAVIVSTSSSLNSFDSLIAQRIEIM